MERRKERLDPEDGLCINHDEIRAFPFLLQDQDHKTIEKQIIIVVQTTPKTHPGGVQGALFRERYHEVLGPSFINQLPMARPLKLISKNSPIKKIVPFIQLIRIISNVL